MNKTITKIIVIEKGKTQYFFLTFRNFHISCIMLKKSIYKIFVSINNFNKNTLKNLKNINYNYTYSFIKYLIQVIMMQIYENYIINLNFFEIAKLKTER